VRILIDIGHPAHVHYFKNCIRLLEDQGHAFLIVARDNDVIHELLRQHSIPFVSRGRGGFSIPGKMAYIARANYVLLRQALRFRPDMMLSVASPYLAQVGWMLRIPTVTLDDTEGAILGRMLYLPFTSMVLTPDTYRNDLGAKQVRVNSSLEMCYLHPKYFGSKIDPHTELGLKPDEPYAIVRLVSWKAVHDRGHRGLSPDRVLQVCRELSKHCRVFISSEAQIPAELQSMRFPLSPDRLHAALSGASLYVGEGATMAAEAAMLGVPSCYVSSIDLGYINTQATLGLIHHYRSADAFLQDLPQVVLLLKKPGALSERNGYFRDRVDMTALLVWLVQNWPSSLDWLKKKGRIAADSDLPGDTGLCADLQGKAPLGTKNLSQDATLDADAAQSKSRGA
jgi:uncharacterized protein